MAKIETPVLNGYLPAEAQEILKAAAKVGEPESKQRRAAIDYAVREVRYKYPQYFHWRRASHLETETENG